MLKAEFEKKVCHKALQAVQRLYHESIWHIAVENKSISTFAKVLNTIESAQGYLNTIL
ncbi:hypothetical protein S1OALGB6SA_2289 [Olavius algarvensis spirochete endosymbiont]|nr:hypothetical protein S1OALGB6SA_2289 [Olavius algarvensis spirochete endosymbiont]